MIRTILGDIDGSEIKVALCHEHICCCHEPLLAMSGRDYLDKDALLVKAVKTLTGLREKYGLNLFVDCTSTNLGRDLELIRKVSEKSGVHIVASTGMYYFVEDMLGGMSAETLAQHIIRDTEINSVGAIKAAVELPIAEDYSDFRGTYIEKALTAEAIAHARTGLPIILHTNAHRRNGLPAARFLIEKGVKPEKITVGHLSDTEDIEYLLKIAGLGCYIGLDRFYLDESEEYIGRKLRVINKLCSAGFTERLILSHDELFFSGFADVPAIKDVTRFDFLLKNILPRLDEETADTLIRKNPVRFFSI